MRLLAVIALAACNSEQQWPGGTGVGNPGTTKVSLARIADAGVTSATATLTTLSVERCNGGADQTEVGEEIDLLDDEPHRVAGGRTCALEARFDPPLRVEGSADEDAGGTFALTLEVARVRVEVADRLVIDEDALLLELGHHEWARAGDELGGLTPGTHLEIGPGHPMHDALVAAIEDGSGLFPDHDRDGTIDPDERAAPVATGPSWQADDD